MGVAHESSCESNYLISLYFCFLFSLKLVLKVKDILIVPILVVVGLRSLLILYKVM